MKWLHCIRTLDPSHGGTVEAVTQFCRAQIQEGQHPSILSLDAPDASFLRNAPCPVHAVGPGLGTYGYSSRYIPWLRQNAINFNTIVVHGLWQFQSFGAWQALHGKTPYSIFPHGMLDPWFKQTYPLKHLKKWLYWPWAEYRVLRDAHTVLFTCEEERLLARRSFWLYRCREAISHLGVQSPSAEGGSPSRALFSAFPSLENNPFFLFLGRIDPKKGCDVLIRAFAQICRMNPSHQLVFAGPDLQGWRPTLEQLAASEGVRDRILWTGMLQGDLKWGALRQADALVLPSHQENFGLAVVEALSCGTPVLISNKVNIWREIQMDEAGWISDDTAADFQQILIQWLQASESQKVTMRANARSSFLRRFQVDTAARQLLSHVHASP